MSPFERRVKHVQLILCKKSISLTLNCISNVFCIFRAAYRQGEQQTLANRTTTQPFRNIKGIRNLSRNRQSNPAADWSCDISNVFPPNDVFDAEMDHHDFQFNQVTTSKILFINFFKIIMSLF